MQQPKRRRPPKGSRLPAAAKAAAAALLLLLSFGAAAAQDIMAMSPASAMPIKPGKEVSSSPSATTAAAASSSTSWTSTSTSTVCPSIARSPTRHVTLVVTGATYVLADSESSSSSGKAAAKKGASPTPTPPTPSRLLEGMLAVNGSVLGPTLEFEDGEDVSIDVVNEVEAAAGSMDNSTATSVHWHGLDLPGAAWADGVSGVTQRPVPRGVSFRYRFKAGPVGTHWYHAHTGLQYANGLRGALIVRPRGGAGKRKSDVGAGYDEERLLVLSDQAAATAEKVFEELQAGMMSMATMQAGGAGAHGGGGGGMETAPAAAAHGSSAAAASEAPKAAAHGRRMRRRRGLSQVAAPAPAPAAAAAAGPHGGGAGKGTGGGMAMGGPPSSSSPSPSSAPASAEPSVVDPQSGCFDSTTTQDISDAPYYATLVNGKGFALVSEPGKPGPPAFAGAPAVVEVKKGRKYRFRMVNAGASWGYNVSVDRHPVALLALDGYPLAVSKAAESGGKKGNGNGNGDTLSAAGLRAVAGVVTTSAETVDFLLDASAPDGVRNYWINVMTITGFGGPAVLHYGEFVIVEFFVLLFSFFLFNHLSCLIFYKNKNSLNLKRAPRTPSPRRARGSSARRRPSSAAPTRGTRPLASPTSRTPPTSRGSSSRPGGPRGRRGARPTERWRW